MRETSLVCCRWDLAHASRIRQWVSVTDVIFASANIIECEESIVRLASVRDQHLDGAVMLDGCGPCDATLYGKKLR